MNYVQNNSCISGFMKYCKINSRRLPNNAIIQLSDLHCSIMLGTQDIKLNNMASCLFQKYIILTYNHAYLTTQPYINLTLFDNSTLH